jgi:hypothetical protein
MDTGEVLLPILILSNIAPPYGEFWERGLGVKVIHLIKEDGTGIDRKKVQDPKTSL